MNYRPIAPITFWSPSGNQQATRLMLYNFHNYNFDGTDSTVSYRLQTEEEVTLSEGSIAIPDDVVQAWGVDDEPMFDYVATKLNLTKL